MKNIKAVIVNGEPVSGKDTFVDYCIDILGSEGIPASKVSSVHMVKEAAMLLGWDGSKDDRGRKFLSDLKDLSSDAYDGPMLFMEKCLEQTEAAVMFFFIREPSEIEKFVERIPGTKTVLIKRPGCEKFDNTGDRDVHSYRYDFVINNDTDLSELHRLAAGFVCVNPRLKGEVKQ